MVFALSLKIFWRELKSGYLNSSLFSLILAVTIVSGISLFTDRLEKALSLESAEFLGGDLKFDSNEIPIEEILEKAKELGLIDGLGNADQILREKFGEEVEIKKFGKPKGWLAKKLSSSQDHTDKLISILEERSIWQRYGL